MKNGPISLVTKKIINNDSALWNWDPYRVAFDLVPHPLYSSVSLSIGKTIREEGKKEVCPLPVCADVPTLAKKADDI